MNRPISPSDHNLAMMHLERQNDVQRKMDLDALKKRLENAPDKSAKLRQACEGFESVFIQKLWEQMRKNVQKSGYLHSRDEHMYQGMYDAEFSKKMTQAGGIGLADMLYEQLSQRLGESSRTKSPGVDPRLPILPAASSPSGLGMGTRPAGLREPGNTQKELSISARGLRPAYEDIPASSAAVNPHEPSLTDLAPFDDGVSQESSPEAKGEKAGLDLESLSHGLMESELSEAGKTAEANMLNAQAGAMPEQTVLSPDDEAILRAALLQSMNEAGRINTANAPLRGPQANSYARYQGFEDQSVQTSGTDFATQVANPAESAGENIMNNLPRS